MGILQKHRRLVAAAAALLVALSVGAVLVFRSSDPSGSDPSADEKRSAEEVFDIWKECQSEASETDQYEEGSYDETYATCLRKRLDMTMSEVENVFFPVSALPACEELWVEGAKWQSSPNNESYGWQCRYGSGGGDRYEADVTYCSGRGTSWLVVGPDDLFHFWEAPFGYDGTVSDGARIGELSGAPAIETARRICADG